MRKIGMLLVAVFSVALPASATMNFYRAANGKIVAEATDCASAQRLLDLIGVPDDPPTKPAAQSTDDSQSPEDAPAANPNTDTADKNDADSTDTQEANGEGEGEEGAQTEGAHQPDPNVVKGTQQLLDAVLGDFSTDPNRTKHEVFANVEANDNEDFEDLQQAFLAFVRDVNWKTGLKLTYRDLSFARRFRMACSGVSTLTKPLRVNLEAYVGNMDDVLKKVGDRAEEGLVNMERGHSFSQVARLSVVGIAYAIEKNNPFLLLLVDEATFKQLVKIEPKIATLYKEMYLFFKIRAIYMPGEEFDQNNKALIRVSKEGTGNSFETWHIMSTFAQKMLALERAGKLNAKDEKEIHIWRLESAMYVIKEKVRVEKRAAELAVQDPQNAQFVQEAKQSPKKKPSLDDKARELLRNMTKDQIKHLIIKYKID